jgi:LysM repeat protein
MRSSLAFVFCLAALSPACTQPDPHVVASPQPSLALSLAPTAMLPPSAAPTAPPSPSVSAAASAFVPSPAPPKGACGPTHVVVAGETLAGIARACYGGRAYADLLSRKNALISSTIRLGQSLATPPLRDLAPCAPAEVCGPLHAAHAAFLEAQAFTEHSTVAPAAASPHLDETTRLLEAALHAAEAKKISRPKSQLRAAIAEIASLRAGSCGEPGYCESTFHQHLVFALETLAREP